MPERDFELVISHIDVVAKGVVRLTLARADGDDLPQWEAGAHVDLHFSANGVDYVRQYSLCGSVTDRTMWQVAVLHATSGRGGSAHIHKFFSVGDKLRVTGPRNNFRLVAARRYLFIAGGIGITPIIPMLAELSAANVEWRLAYCGRSTQTMAFIDEILKFGSDKILVHESDASGLLDLRELIEAADSDTLIYCCGPEAMLSAVDEICASWSDDRVHIERFTRREDGPAVSDAPFEVEFARSGLVATIPCDRSILDIAEELGIDVESSCQEGVCGSCETKVLSGIPCHRDTVLSAKERAEGQTMMICVSRSSTHRLVLDA